MGFLVAACMRDLVPRPGVEPGPSALGAWSLTHWTTKQVPRMVRLLKLTIQNAGKDAEQQDCALLVGMQNDITTLENSLAISYKVKHIHHMTQDPIPGYLLKRNENSPQRPL